MKIKLWHIAILWLLIIPFLGYSQSIDALVANVKIEAKRWVKGYPDQPWEPFNTRILVDTLYLHNDSLRLSSYGSSNEKSSVATGYFRVEKNCNRWWIVDPEGYYNIQRVINGFRRGTSERNDKSFDARFKSENEWVIETAERFAQIGLNGTGSWSTDTLIQAYNSKSNLHKLSYSINLRFMAAYGRKRGGTYQLPGNIGFPNQTIFVFDPEFQTFSDSLAKAEIYNLRNDPNLLGYFSDNELPFSVNNLEGYLTLINPADPGRLAAEKWLKDKGIMAENITDKERNQFAGFVAEIYYKIVSEAIRKADPNHLYLGSRVHGRAKFVPEIMKSAGKYCDVVSINYYGIWTPSSDHMSNWAKWTNKPFIITEFYTKAMDSGLANTTGAGYTVRTQKDRGMAYQDFCLALLESKHCVGWHYFKYQDNDPTAKGVDPSNIDSNKGIVNNDYDFYLPLVDKMSYLNNNIYNLIRLIDQQISINN